MKLAVLLLAAVQAPERLSAQATAPSIVHRGKWISLAGSIGLALAANAKHDEADRRFATLEQRCIDVPSSCIIAPSHVYVDPLNESLYQESRSLDRQAGRFLIGAEVLFVTSAAGFVWELMHRTDHPPTIPFEPRVESTSSQTRVSLTLRF